MEGLFRLRGLEGNFFKYALMLVSNKRVFVAILGAYYLTVPGVTPWWVGIILLTSSLAGFVFEIPSGYIADKMGHKKALVLSRLFILASTLFFLLSTSIPFLILGGVFLSISQAFLSGTGTAFLHETLRALNRESEFREVQGKLSSIGFGIPIAMMVLVPFLVGISWHLPFLVALIFDIVGLIAVCAFVVPPVTPEHIEEIRITNFRQVMEEAWQLNFFRYAIFSGVLGGLLFAVGSFRAVYQSALDIPVVWFGVFFGIGRAMASFLLWHSGRIQRMLKTSVKIYGVKLLIFGVLIFVLALTENKIIVVSVFMLINGFHWGLNNIGYSVETIAKSKFKATLLSVKSQIQTLVGGGAALLMGYLVAEISYQSTFLIITLIFIFILFPVLYLICKDRNGGGGEGDSGGE